MPSTLKSPAENRDRKRGLWSGKLGFRRKAAQEEMRQTPPLQGGTGKKIPTDKSRDFAYGGNLQYELVAAKFGKFSKCLGNASLESP